MNNLEWQLRGYRLTTAEICYRQPDFQDLLQFFIWQTLDIAPDYPVLRKFLIWWQKNVDGPLHSVTVGSTELIKPSEFRVLAKSVNELLLH